METVAGEQSAAESDRDSGALFVLPSAGTPAQQSFTHNVGSTVGSVSVSYLHLVVSCAHWNPLPLRSCLPTCARGWCNTCPATSLLAPCPLLTHAYGHTLLCKCEVEPSVRFNTE